jgi:H+-transporting ATPase
MWWHPLQALTNSPPPTLTLSQLFISKTDLKRGLDSATVKRRFEEWGPNELQEKKVNPLLLFLSYFWVR